MYPNDDKRLKKATTKLPVLISGPKNSLQPKIQVVSKNPKNPAYEGGRRRRVQLCRKRLQKAPCPKYPKQNAVSSAKPAFVEQLTSSRREATDDDIP